MNIDGKSEPFGIKTTGEYVDIGQAQWSTSAITRRTGIRTTTSWPDGKKAILNMTDRSSTRSDGMDIQSSCRKASRTYFLFGGVGESPIVSSDIRAGPSHVDGQYSIKSPRACNRDGPDHTSG